jgi:hypothetical protein
MARLKMDPTEPLTPSCVATKACVESPNPTSFWRQPGASAPTLAGECIVFEDAPFRH